MDMATYLNRHQNEYDKYGARTNGSDNLGKSQLKTLENSVADFSCLFL